MVRQCQDPSRKQLYVMNLDPTFVTSLVPPLPFVPWACFSLLTQSSEVDFRHVTPVIAYAETLLCYTQTTWHAKVQNILIYGKVWSRRRICVDSVPEQNKTKSNVESVNFHSHQNDNITDAYASWRQQNELHVSYPASILWCYNRPCSGVCIFREHNEIW
jgi:hypothetical protein